LNTEKEIKFNHIGTQKEAFSCIFIPSFTVVQYCTKLIQCFCKKHIFGLADIFGSVMGEEAFNILF